MLVLTRKLMEKLYIGDDICITVVRLEGGQVRLGIEAPRDVPVVRAELLEERALSAGRVTYRVRSGGAESVQVRSQPVESHEIDSRHLGRSR